MDAVLLFEIEKRWEMWLKNLPVRLTMPRAIPRDIGVLVELILHGFADASLLSCCAVINALIKQPGMISHRFLTINN